MSRKFTLPVFFIVAVLWVWAVIVEPYLLLNKIEVEAAARDFPEGFQNLKIAVVADIHYGRGPHERLRIERIVKAVNAERPDIILFLGDYANGYYFQTTAREPEIVRALSAFKAPLGKYGILGNHDYLLGEGKVKKILRDSDIVPLCNSNVRVSSKYGDFYVAAITDPHSSSYSYKAALKGIPAGAPIIFLTHNPAVVREIPQRVDLVLAGHTHGGQIRLPYLGNVVPLKDIPRPLAAGLSRYYNHTIYTSMGLGTSRFPARFFCVPEFTILRVSPKK